METLTFRAVQDGERIDRYLSGCLEDLSRSYIQKLVKEGNIRVDGRIVKANYKLSVGEEIRVLVPEPEVPDIRPENIPLDILYETTTSLWSISRREWSSIRRRDIMSIRLSMRLCITAGISCPASTGSCVPGSFTGSIWIRPDRSSSARMTRRTGS